MATNFEYIHADGSVQTAETASEARAICPVLGGMAIEQANLMLEMAALGNAKIAAENNRELSLNPESETEQNSEAELDGFDQLFDTSNISLVEQIDEASAYEMAADSDETFVQSTANVPIDVEDTVVHTSAFLDYFKSDQLMKHTEIVMDPIQANDVVDEIESSIITTHSVVEDTTHAFNHFEAIEPVVIRTHPLNATKPRVADVIGTPIEVFEQFKPSTAALTIETESTVAEVIVPKTKKTKSVSKTIPLKIIPHTEQDRETVWTESETTTIPEPAKEAAIPEASEGSGTHIDVPIKVIEEVPVQKTVEIPELNRSYVEPNIVIVPTEKFEFIAPDITRHTAESKAIEIETPNLEHARLPEPLTHILENDAEPLSEEPLAEPALPDLENEGTHELKIQPKILAGIIDDVEKTAERLVGKFALIRTFVSA